MTDDILHKLISMNFENVSSDSLVISFYLTISISKPWNLDVFPCTVPKTSNY